MTREQVKVAKREGIPFQINMADGRSYSVTDPDAISVGLTTIAIFDKDDVVHVLPLLTMTGLTYLNGKPAE